MAAPIPLIQETPKLLIVEDEPGLRFLVSTVFEDDGGFDLVVARSADEALRILTEDEKIRYVFTDIRMPGRYDGIDLTKSILADYPAIKVVLTSGNDYAASPVEGVTFVPKPYELSSIPRLFRKLAFKS